MAGTVIADNLQAASTSQLIIKNGVANTPPTIQDSAGTEIGTFCRAWVNFDGTGTVAINASFNVTSITDNGSGDYTLNFTNAMSDANYTAVFGTTAGSTSTNNYVQGIHVTGASSTGAATTKTTSALRILGRSTNGNSVDCVQNNVAIFR